MEPLLVVISSSSSEADIAFRNELEKQLHPLVRQGLIDLWHAGHVRPGEPQCEVVLQKIRSAHIIMPLVTADYLANEDHEHELSTAIGRSAQARVLPVLVRSCTFPGTALKQMKLLPEGGTAVVQWTRVDDAWASVARSLRQTIHDIQNGKSHYAPVNVVQTAAMAPALAAAPPSVPTPVISSARPSIISIPPAVPVSVPVPMPASSPAPATSSRGSAAPPVAPLVPEQAPPQIKAPGRPRTPLGAVGLLLLGAALAFFLLKYSVLMEGRSPPSTSAAEVPSATARAPQPMQNPARPANEKPVCCAGVDCPDSERQAAGSFCEQYPTYCSRCPSGRPRVEGACADRLPSLNNYHLRVGQAMANGVPVPAGAKICFRRAGTPDALTCATANEARAGKAAVSLTPADVATLTGSPGLDFDVTLAGVTLASGRGALARGGAIKTSVLCVGIVIHAPGPLDDSITVFLDP